MASSEVARLFVSVDARISGLEKGLAAAEARSLRASKSIDRSAMAASASWKRAAAGIGALAGLNAAKNELVGFDRSMRNVNSIAQLSEGRFKSLSRSVEDMAGKTAQGPKTLAEGMYQLVSSGFSAKQSLKILASTAKAASAGLTDTATSTKAVAAVLNAYHLPASKAAAVSDDLFQTVNLGVLSFEDLASNIGDVLPFATALGVGLKDVGAATSTMTKAGVSAPETMTRIKGAMVGLIKPTTELKQVYKTLGVTTGEDLIRKFGSFQGALQAISGTVGGNREAMAKFFPDIRGLGGAFLLTGQNAGAANRDLRGFADTVGATDKVLKEQKKSLDYQWRQFKAELAATVDQYGTKLIPALSTSLKIVKASAPALIAAGAAWGTYKTVALVNIAAVKAAELGLFGGAMRAKVVAAAAVTGAAAGTAEATAASAAASRIPIFGPKGQVIKTVEREVAGGLAGAAGGAGVAAGAKTLGMSIAKKAGLVAGAGIAGWELGKMLRKHVGPVRAAGDWLGSTFGKAIWGGVKNQSDLEAKTVAQGIANDLKRGLPVKQIMDNAYGADRSTPGPAVVPKGAFKGGQDAGYYRSVAFSAAKAAGISTERFLAQIQQESGFDPKAKSKAGARGIAQIMPGTAKAWGVNASDPIASLYEAARRMAGYIKQFGSWKNALVAYNAGPGRVGGPLPAETADYVKKILGASGGGAKQGGGSDYGKAIKEIAASRGTNMTVAGLAYAVQQLFGAAPGVGKFGHQKYTKSGNVSDHFTGNAIDIPAAGAENVKIARWLQKNFGKQIKQLIYSGNDSAATGDHSDHVHAAITNQPGLRARILAAVGQGDRGGLPFTDKLPKADNRVSVKALGNKEFLAFIQARIERFDLMVQAGLMSATRAALMKRAVIKSRLGDLTGDAKLQALGMLRGLPRTTELQAEKKKEREQWAKVAERYQSAQAARTVDPTLDNPWLKAYFGKIDTKVLAGDMTEVAGMQSKKERLQAALPYLSGDQADEARAEIRELTKAIDDNTKAQNFSASALTQGAAGIGGSVVSLLSQPGGKALLTSLVGQGIDQIPGGLSLSSLLAASDPGGTIKDFLKGTVLPSEIAEFTAPGLTDEERQGIWQQILSTLGEIATASNETAANTQAQLDLQAQTIKELQRELGVSQAGIRTLSRLVSQELGQKVGRASKTPSAGIVY